MLVRFESPTQNEVGYHVGVFGLANGLARSGRLSAEDWSWWRASNDWCNAAYPDPTTVDPAVYDQVLNPGARAWFRSSATDLIAKAREYVALLDEYEVACVERYTRAPGRVVYGDKVQVIAVPVGALVTRRLS
nr:hypothetical protein [Isoptericola chiayiensis]